MNLQRLLSMREGQRSLIEDQLRELEEAKSASELDNFVLILESIEELAATLKTVDDKITNQCDPEILAAEVRQIGTYNLRLKLNISKQRKFYQDSLSTNTSCIGNENINQSSQKEIPSYYSSADDTFSTQQTTVLNQQIVRNMPLQRNSLSASVAHHKLPKLSLPTFNGDVLLWQTFWDSFSTTVHNNSNLSDIEKFSYLRAQLEGNAARTIEGFSLTHANYAQALNLLTERFGQTDKITSAHMQALLQLPTSSECLEDLSHFYDRLESNIRGLDSLGQAQDGALLIPIILDKLSPATRQHLTRDHGTGSWTLSDQRKAIRREIEILEAGQPRDVKHDCYFPTASFHIGAMKKHGSKQKLKQQRKESFAKNCVFCDQPHKDKCQRISSVKSRISIVKTKRLCFNCLSKRHQVSNCPSKFRCRQYRGKHHTSICERTATSTSRDAPQSTTQTLHSSEENAAIMHFASRTSRSDVLLKAAIAPVCSGDHYADANILINEGAQRSFISQKLADILQLKHDGNEVIHLSAFGDSTHNVCRLNRATVNVIADDGERIPIQVLIVPVIAKPINNRFRKSVPSLRYRQGLKLAHPVTMDDAFDISLLIGADFYWQIVGDRIIRGDGPTAVCSRIGYFLSGSYSVSCSSTSQEIIDVSTTHLADTSDISQFWESMRKTDDNSIQFLHENQDNSISFENERYVARLPWKPNYPPLPTNHTFLKKRTSPDQRIHRWKRRTRAGRQSANTPWTDNTSDS